MVEGEVSGNTMEERTINTFSSHSKVARSQYNMNIIKHNYYCMG